MNYDDWSSDDILEKMGYEGFNNDLVAALRKAVVREASVGVVKLSHNGVASDYDIIPKETT